MEETTKKIEKQDKRKIGKETKETKEIDKQKHFALKKEKQEENLLRIVGTDIPAKMNVYTGLTKIKGISWSVSNAVCELLGIDKKRKISSLTEEEISKIVNFIKNPKLPAWLLNRRNDFETGKGKHLITTELDLQKEFDIKRIKKIRSYKGIRHLMGQPVRGQRTKSHFRSKGKSIGVKREKSAPAKAK